MTIGEGEDEDITTADRIENISVNTSSEALDNVIIESYKHEIEIYYF